MPPKTSLSSSPNLWVALALLLSIASYLGLRYWFDHETGASFACAGSLLLLILLLCLAALLLEENLELLKPLPLAFQLLCFLLAFAAETLLWSQGPHKNALLLPGFSLALAAALGEILLLRSLSPSAPNKKKKRQSPWKFQSSWGSFFWRP